MKNHFQKYVNNNINRNQKNGTRVAASYPNSARGTRNPLCESGNMLHIPIFQPIAGSNINSSSNNSKKILTTDDLIKFIDNNRKYITNPDDKTQDIQIINDISQPLIIDATSKLRVLKPFQIEKLNNHKIFKGILNVDEYNITRFGVLDIMNCKNISFITSVLSLLIDDFVQFHPDTQYSYINNLMTFAESKLNEYMKTYKSSKYDKKSILDSLESFDFDTKIIKYIGDILCVNIFIIVDNDLILYNTEFIKYKKNIFLMKVCNSYEPIHFGNNKYLLYNDEIMLNMLSHINNIFMYGPKLDDIFKLVESVDILEKYIKDIKLDYKDKLLIARIQKNNEPKIVNTNADVHEECDKFEEIMDCEEECIRLDIESDANELDKKKKIEYDAKDLEKKKVSELKEIAENMGIECYNSISGKQKLKKKIELINNICNNKSK